MFASEEGMVNNLIPVWQIIEWLGMAISQGIASLEVLGEYYLYLFCAVAGNKK